MSNRIPTTVSAILLCLGVTVSAQTTGRVNGRVLDQTGAALPGVAIDLVVNSRGLTTTTDDQGVYRFDAVPTGNAELTFRRLNFSVLRRSARVAGGVPVTADVVLTLSLGADVVVTAAGTFRNIADVEDPAANLVGIAASASQGAVTAAQLDERPIMRAGEVLETVPGLVVSQHSGEGKANQYYLRGFNLDHGTDFSTTVAGVPVNTPTGAHAHGYADVSFLIPELVSSVQFKKGPYFADEGDFSAAGAANINYVNQLDRPIVRVSGGNGGWGRVFGAASPRLGGGYLLGAVEVNQNDGPWVRPDDYRKLNGVLRYSRGDNRNGFSLTGMGYWADWDSTDQIPMRAIAEGLIPRFGLLDASDGGKANRESVAAEYQRSNGPSSLRATGFLLHNSLNLFSNFTYFLDDPDNGDQFEQAERRIAAGGRLTYRRLGHFFERHAESAVGVQLRRDRLDPVGLYHTSARRRLSATREDEVGQTMAAVYAQSEIEWTRSLRTTFGLRADRYQFSVSSDNPLNSGDGSDGLVSPKLGATPSRSAILTGRFALRSGTHSVSITGLPYGLVQWEITLAKLLATQGYATGHFGKWHLGNVPGRLPTDQGFDEWYGIPDTTDESLWPSTPGFDPKVAHVAHIMEGRKGEPSREVTVYDLTKRPEIDMEITARTIDFMKRRAAAQQPFYAYVPYTLVHFPTLPSAEFKGATGNGDWADCLAQMDHNVGRLLDTIDELGLRDDTIVVFTSDNGADTSVPPHIGTSGPWAGTMFTPMEGNNRVPFIVRWPGQIPADRESNEIVHEVDTFTTLARFAGAAVPQDRPIDGVDLGDFFRGNTDRSARESFPIFFGEKLYGAKWRNFKYRPESLALARWAGWRGLELSNGLALDDIGCPEGLAPHSTTTWRLPPPPSSVRWSA